MDTNSSSEKVVVVTGASAGPGRSIVREFAKNGCIVKLSFLSMN